MVSLFCADNAVRRSEHIWICDPVISAANFLLLSIKWHISSPGSNTTEANPAFTDPVGKIVQSVILKGPKHHSLSILLFWWQILSFSKANPKTIRSEGIRATKCFLGDFQINHLPHNWSPFHFPKADSLYASLAVFYFTSKRIGGLIQDNFECQGGRSTHRASNKQVLPWLPHYANTYQNGLYCGCVHPINSF